MRLERFILSFFMVVTLLFGCTDTHKPSKTKKQIAMDKAILTAPENHIEQTAYPGLYLKAYRQQATDLKHTLVILDLDDTAITSPEGQWLGRSEMFYDMLSKEIADTGDSKQKAAERIDPLLTSVYWRVPVTLTDSSLSSVIASYQQAGATVIGMTSRGQGLMDLTLHQLEKTQLRFSHFTPTQSISLTPHKHLLIKEGVVMVGHGSTKGSALTALFDVHALPDTLEHIIMIDDRDDHLKTIQQAISQHFGSIVRYTPVLCTYPDTVAPYNSQEAYQQLVTFLWDWRNDAAIKQLITNDAQV